MNMLALWLSPHNEIVVRVISEESFATAVTADENSLPS